MVHLEAMAASTPGLEVRAGEPLARHTTFRIGGPAELMIVAASQSALRALLSETHRLGRPCFLLGLGSNVLFPDDGLPGLVVRLGGHFRRLRVWGERVSAGGAVTLGRLAQRTAALGLGGLEALGGFPSTVGGAVAMNAGCYGTEIKDVLLAATVIERDGTLHRLSPADLEPAYRSTVLQRTGGIVARASFQLRPAAPAALLARMRELNERRWASLPGAQGNAGSIFKNPPGDFAGRLIEACGLKGRRIGRAEISPRHANVIVNLGGATARQVLELMVLARAAVAERFGVTLEPEIVLTGELARQWRSQGAGALPAAG